MRIKNLCKIVPLSMLLTLAGCAQFGAPSRSFSDTPEKDAAYLYGRFTINTEGLVGSGLNMGLRINCEEGVEYMIGFSKDSNPQLIKIKPAKCSFTEIVYTHGGQIRMRKTAPSGAFQNEDFVAGKAYYLGDFTADATTEGFGNSTRAFWKLKTALDGYATTTDEMKKTYEKFSSIPTQKRLLTHDLSFK